MKNNFHFVDNIKLSEIAYWTNAGSYRPETMYIEESFTLIYYPSH